MAFAYGSMTRMFPTSTPTSTLRVKRIETFNKRINADFSQKLIQPTHSLRRSKLSLDGAFASRTTMFTSSSPNRIITSRGYSTVAKEEIVMEQELLPGGSAYTLHVPLPSQGNCVFVLDGDKTVKQFTDEIKSEDNKVTSVELKTLVGSKVSSGTPFRYIPPSDLTLSINNLSYKVTRKTTQSPRESYVPFNNNNFARMEQQWKPMDLTHMNPNSIPRQTVVTNTTVDPVTTVVESRTHELLPEEVDDLARLKEEIKPLLLQKMKLDKKAERFSNAVIYSGLGYLVAQWLVMARLTWWEFNWDIMEPVTYFVTFGTAVIGYSYFTLVKREYTFVDLREALITNRQAKYYFRENFDVDTYFELENRIKKYDPQAVEDLKYFLEYHIEPETPPATPSSPRSSEGSAPDKVVANPS